MKKTKLIVAAFSACLVIGLLFQSCKKNTPNPATDEETATAQDNANAEHLVSDLTEMTAQASDGSAGLASYREMPEAILGLSCATIATDTINKTVIITFNGSAPCLDGHTRSGSLLLNYSASTNGAKHYRDPGFSCTIASNNYIVDGNQVFIQNKTVTNTTAPGFNPATTNETWSITANVSIIKPNGGRIAWACQRVKTLLNTNDPTVYHGAPTPISWNKARVGLSGSANGTSFNGINFTANITSQLIRDFGGCTISGHHPLIQGTLDFIPSGKPTRIIDYGQGTCDLDATITVNGVTKHITLP
jgi:hypothetical protein